MIQIDLRRFLRDICKLSDPSYDALGSAILSGTFATEDEWETYLKPVSDVPYGQKKALHEPLVVLYDWLRTRLGSLPRFQSTTGLRFRDTSGTPLLAGPWNASRKPDLAGISDPCRTDKPHWMDVLLCLEVQHDEERRIDDGINGQLGNQVNDYFVLYPSSF